MTKTKRQLRVGDILRNSRVPERMIVVAAEEENVWVRVIESGDELKVEDGSVWLKLGKDWKHQCTQSYAQAVFALEDEDGEN